MKCFHSVLTLFYHFSTLELYSYIFKELIQTLLHIPSENKNHCLSQELLEGISLLYFDDFEWKDEVSQYE